MNYKHFGIPIFVDWKKDFLNELEKNIKDGKKWYCVTPNPEMMLLQSQNMRFKNILKSAKWNLPDWFWLILGSFLEQKKPKNIFSFLFYIKIFLFLKMTKYKTPINERICWSDIFFDICKLSSENYFRIFLIWWSKWIAKKVRKKLEEKYPEISIVWTSGWYEDASSEKTFDLIKKTKPQIVFIAMWAPHQEYWIEENFNKFNSIKFAIWVWWTFDFVIWKQKRAPKFLRKIWLEWAFRLLTDKTRRQRIFNATFWYLKFVRDSLRKKK